MTKDQPLTTDPTTGQPTPATSPGEAGGTIAGGDPESPREQPKPGAGEKPPEAVREQADKPAEGEKPGPARGEDGKFAAKPVDYAAAIKAPDGVALDPDMLGKAAEVFGRHKLSAEAAQELVDVYGATLKAVDAQAVADWRQQVAAWRSELEADKDFGGHATARTKGEVAKAIDVFGVGADGSDDRATLRNILNETGVGNHPALVRLLARAGRAAAEDRLIPGGAPVQADPLRALYPSMFQGT